VVNGITWCCLSCRGCIEPGQASWRCLACGMSFRALRGIPDLRTRDDLFLSNADDWSFAQALDAHFDGLDFPGLLDRYFDLFPEIAPDLRRRQITHILTAPERSRRWLDCVGEGQSGPLLDLGCGTGSFLASIGHDTPGVCGVDIAMRWLLVARKRLDEDGLGHVPLVCACAEDLPLADSSFSTVIAGDVIEHVADQAATLVEAHRVLRPGGRLFLASPNRFSLAPEPHVRVWGVGYLPRRWMAPYVRRARRIDFRAIRTLGYGEWKRLLRASPFRDGAVTVPPLPSADLVPFGPVKRWVAQLYNAIVPTRIGQWLARAVGPLFHVVCEKQQAAGSQRSSNPAIRPHSRRSAVRE
jgi:SAM-dependent methyltransferase